MPTRSTNRDKQKFDSKPLYPHNGIILVRRDDAAMKRTAFCVTLTLCAIFLVGCAAQVQSKTQAPNSAQAELPQVRGIDNAAEAADTPLLPAEGKATETDAGVESSKSTPQEDASADKAAKKQPTSGKTVQPAVPELPATSKKEPTATPPSAPPPNLLLRRHPSLTLRRLRPAGTSTPSRRPCGWATSMRRRSTA